MATSLTGRRLRRRQADTRRLQAETPMRHSLGGAGIRGKTRRSPAGASTPGTIRRSTSRPNRQTGSRYRGHRSAFAISRFKAWVGAAIARVDLRMWRGAAFSGPFEPLGRPLLEALRSVRRTSPVRTAHLATGGCALPCLRRTAGKHRAWRPIGSQGAFPAFLDRCNPKWCVSRCPIRSSSRILHPALRAAGLERAGTFDTPVVGKLMRTLATSTGRYSAGTQATR